MLISHCTSGRTEQPIAEKSSRRAARARALSVRQRKTCRRRGRRAHLERLRVVRVVLGPVAVATHGWCWEAAARTVW
ncbi:hypothetical protein FA95DRAFT_1230574 [Auriscalpium vulgare]|uniref:Uncharacterized protein n=1 Tax=Auriscalpium vulgare TaxID=40419 RepID=A0ACB8RUP2_9AGAM|nr:hypothetical protein FA95DRAFT_1230574 [Auriscalpium vulgare]